GLRRRRAAHLWIPHIGAVRADAVVDLVGDRRRGRRRTRLFRRLDGPAVPALYLNLDIGASTLSAVDHFLDVRSWIFRADRNPALILLGRSRWIGARRIPARSQF